MDRVKRIWYLSPSLLAHTSSESRGTVRQNARSLAQLNGWACAVVICHDGMLEDTNSLDGAHMIFVSFICAISSRLFLFNYHQTTYKQKLACLNAISDTAISDTAATVCGEKLPVIQNIHPHHIHVALLNLTIFLPNLERNRFTQEMSHLMRFWHFSSSVHSFFKQAYAAILWG